MVIWSTWYKNCFRVKNRERGEITGKTWVMYKHTETRNWWKNKILSSIPKLHTGCHLKKHRPISGPTYRMQVVHPRSQTPQGESGAKPGTLLLIILNYYMSHGVTYINNVQKNLGAYFGGFIYITAYRIIIYHIGIHVYAYICVYKYADVSDLFHLHELPS